MKLYYSPEACSLAPHIVLRELDIPFQLVRVDHPTKTTSEGDNYLDISPCGYVAALRLDDGRVLTEGSAILEYLADLKPNAGLAPAADSWERVRLRERLSFLSCELNSTMNPLFKDAIPDEVKALFRERLFKRLDLLDRELNDQTYQLENRYSVADAYLFTLLSWLRWFSIGFERWPALALFQERVGQRPAVKAALIAELE
ncbi:glutathione binding-like protein [Pseudomonas sp. C9-3]|uniref:glutathione binding-like protein n=1 Tax=Pseudomonas sp. C9-3 TaxID=3078264 RepID=UPI0028E8DA18|nr:glutathione binding-like protein [Pseudomonas sp. C9-3]